jgi:hypothetical protein
MSVNIVPGITIDARLTLRCSRFFPELVSSQGISILNKLINIKEALIISGIS